MGWRLVLEAAFRRTAHTWQSLPSLCLRGGSLRGSALRVCAAVVIVTRAMGACDAGRDLAGRPPMRTVFTVGTWMVPGKRLLTTMMESCYENWWPGLWKGVRLLA
jgi:hypothetical protein